MTSASRPTDDSDRIERAIARVLEAEAAAKEAIADAGARAAAAAEAARASARAVGERTERRLRAVRAAFERRTGATVAALDREAEEASATHVLGAADLARVEAAVAALAARLASSGE